jgi:hypothetical protein
VQLSVGGKQLSQKLELRKDPNSGGTDADIQKQMTVLTELAREINRAAGMINQMELVRSQIQNLGRIVADRDVMQEAAAVERKLADLEMNLIDLRATGRGQDGVRWGAKLYGKFLYLANGLMSGDFAPTNQQLEVQKELEGRLRSLAGQFDAFQTGDLAKLNEQLRKRNLPIVVTRPSTSSSD